MCDSKVCNKCGVEKMLSEFYFRNDNKRYVARCKDCVRETNKSWSEKNKDIISKNKKKYRDSNKSIIAAKRKVNYKKNRRAILDQKKKYQEDNKEMVSLKGRLYYAANKSIIIAKRKTYKEANKGIVSALNSRRRASKLKATPLWANQELVTSFYKQAKRFEVWLGVEYHVDHIIPLKHPDVCGLHNEFNLQIIPAIDNMKKSNKFNPDDFTEVYQRCGIFTKDLSVLQPVK